MTSPPDSAPYRDPTRDVRTRVNDLLDRMTLRELAGQTVGTWGGQMDTFHDAEDVRAAVTDHGVGALATFGWTGALDVDPHAVVERVNDLQQLAREETRLEIPLLFCADAVHGHAYVANTTIFPSGLGTGATWDPDLVERGADVCATELAATGGGQTYSPTCDLAREPRWGRVFETLGESPHLVADLAAAKVRGYQGEDLSDDDAVLATAKHFPAYSQPERGEDAAPAEISDFRLQNTFLPPFEAVIDEDVASVMPSYNATNGAPIHGSRAHLTDLLRGDLDFDGHVASDWQGIRHLHEAHGVSHEWRESVHRAREAGIDLASIGTAGHVDRLVDLVESGDLDRSVVRDQAARVLAAKFRLGLFEDPFVDPERAEETLASDAHREAAREAAEASVTLLQNHDDLLPLAGDEDVLLAGPNADDIVAQVGGWSVQEADQVAGATIRDALADRLDGDLTYVQGTERRETLDVSAAAEAASEADVAVVAVGEGWYIHEFGPSPVTGVPTGEWPHRSDLRLPDAQRELLAAIHDTGTPVVGVLVSGRPLIVDWMAEHLPAILNAYYPGSEGGPAVANALLGEVDPGGRLPVTMPADEADLPQVHDYQPHPAPIGEEEQPPSYDPLFEFGHGLSYADFDYVDVTAPDVVGPGERFTVSVTIENVADRDGREVVQLYGRQATPRYVRPVRELVAFERVALDAGERTTVELELPARRLGYYRPDDGHVVAADDYHLTVGDCETVVQVEGRYR